MKKLYLTIITLVLVFTGLGSPPVRGGSTKQLREYQLKAAYLLNFAKFATWPESVFASPQDPFVICILGDDPFGNALVPLTARKLKGHKIEIHYCTELKALQPSNLLFICRSEIDQLPAIMEACAGAPIFTISDIQKFIHQGGMLEFIQVKGHLRFSINLDNVKQSGLKLNSQLLSLANEVIGGQQ